MTATAIGSYATAAALKALIGIDSEDDTHDELLGLICDRVNQYIETTTGNVMAPIGSTTYLYDGNGLTRIFLPLPVDEPTRGVGGARAVTLVEFAPYTGASFETIASTDYVLRQRHTIKGPYRWLCMSDKPAGAYTTFPVGRANIRVTMTAGWDAIPDDLTDTALAIAHRNWNAREAGQQNVAGADEFGAPSVARWANSRDKAVLRAYTLKAPV